MKIKPLRSMFVGDKLLKARKVVAVDDETAQICLQNVWAEAVPETSKEADNSASDLSPSGSDDGRENHV